MDATERPGAAATEAAAGQNSPEWHARWESALAELELDLERAEAILASDHLPVPDRGWRPPSGLGPLPAPLRERAQLLVDRQIDVAQRMAASLVANRRHARALGSMRAGTPAVPVYVDTAG